MDQGVTENTIILVMVKGHVDNGAVMDGHIRSIMFPCHFNGRFSYFYTRYRHPIVPEKLGIPSITDTRNEHIFHCFSDKKVVSHYSGTGRFKAPHFPLFDKIC